MVKLEDSDCLPSNPLEIAGAGSWSSIGSIHQTQWNHTTATHLLLRATDCAGNPVEINNSLSLSSGLNVSASVLHGGILESTGYSYNGTMAVQVTTNHALPTTMTCSGVGVSVTCDEQASGGGSRTSPPQVGRVDFEVTDVLGEHFHDDALTLDDAALCTVVGVDIHNLTVVRSLNATVIECQDGSGGDLEIQVTHIATEASIDQTLSATRRFSMSIDSGTINILAIDAGTRSTSSKPWQRTTGRPPLIA